MLCCGTVMLVMWCDVGAGQIRVVVTLLGIVLEALARLWCRFCLSVCHCMVRSREAMRGEIASTVDIIWQSAMQVSNEVVLTRALLQTSFEEPYPRRHQAW